MIKSQDCDGCRFQNADCPYDWNYGHCMEDSFTARWKKRLVSNYNLMCKDLKDGYSEGLSGRRKK